MNRPRPASVAAVVTTAAIAAGAIIAGARVTARRRKPAAGARDGLRVGRAARTGDLVRLTSGVGVDYARMTAGSAFRSDERRAELQARFELRSAEQVAEVLGNMKGAVMKLGQMASYLDGGLPAPVREALAQMQQDAPPMSWDLVADVITRELGGPPEQVFATFEHEPLAAASIGQVHRAVTHDGRAVAVKVQYPGVDEAIGADLGNSDLLFGMLGMMLPGLDPEPIVNELRERLTEELDYRNEAANQTRFAEYYRGHPTIFVPSVVEEHSTGRVLCTELADGARWAEVLTWSQERRDLAAETIYRFAFGGIYRLGVFNGDPHPGNYLFGPDGRVVFLDYGLCKIFTPDEISRFEQMIRSMVFEQDPAEVRRVWTEIGVLRSDAPVSDADVHDYFVHFFEQVLIDGVTLITPEYASDSLRRYFDLNGPYAEIMRAVTLPSFMVIIQRINLGLFAIFGELRASNNWRRLAEEIWPFVDAEPSTPMGERIRVWEIERGHRAPSP